MQRRHFISLAPAALAAPWARAQGSWPSQQIRWVVPYPAGGGTDALARSISEAMRPALNNQVLVVDNRPGASGNVGAEFVARSEADGHTLLLTTGQLIRVEIFPVRHSHFIQHFSGPLFGFCLRDLPGSRQAFHHILKSCHVPEQIVALEHKSHLHAESSDLWLAHSSDILSEIIKLDLALVCPLQKTDAAQQGCFSRTTVSKNCDHRSLFYFKIDAL